MGGVREKFDMIFIRYGTWNKQNEYVLLRWSEGGSEQIDYVLTMIGGGMVCLTFSLTT